MFFISVLNNSIELIFLFLFPLSKAHQRGTEYGDGGEWRSVGGGGKGTRLNGDSG